MTFTDRAKKYANGVIKGKVPACLYVKQACRRFLDDLKRKDIYLDTGKPGAWGDAERWCRFLEKLPHVKGEWAKRGEKMTLEDWQVFIIVNTYGWKVKKTKLRRFRKALIFVPRKNGKSFLAAGLGLGHLCIDNEYGAEILCGAGSQDQAFKVFGPARQMCQNSPEMRKHFGLEVNAKSLSILETGSKFEPVIGKPGDGGNPSCAIVDEYHEHADSDQVDTFETGMGAREQPMMLIITTAGEDTGGPCYAEYDDLIKLLNGSTEDDSVFGIIFTVDEDDEWDTIEAQQKANPNYGVSIKPAYLEAQLRQARRSAYKQSAYKTKYLNLWVGAMNSWMNILAYQACRKTDLKMEMFKGKRCFAGLDLASKRDIASLAIVFPPNDITPRWSFFCKHYLPEERVEDVDRYLAWHKDEWLTATPGNITDFEYIRDDLKALKSDYHVIEVPYDPFQATQFASELLTEGFPMIEYGATVKNFSEPMKELEAIVLEKKGQFTMDPVLLWMFGNVVAKVDKKDNIYPNKAREDNKIDGVVAIIMALARALVTRQSVYETRGIRTV